MRTFIQGHLKVQENTLPVSVMGNEATTRLVPRWRPVVGVHLNDIDGEGIQRITLSTNATAFVSLALSTLKTELKIMLVNGEVLG